ncbi:AAA family ATPase [Streptomyces sp. NPDC039022]|uniref:AAA family ATPase n=1 Tax=unclassified Streptomyces TaxID=2593676 RepID=UPI0033C6BE2F
MLLWINGPFGGGKTQTAHEIQRRLPGSVICDPEHVGFGLHRMTPPALRGDFQDLPAWRQGVHEVLDLALTKHPGTVIAPMTLVETAYFEEIVGRLRDHGHDVRHFALLADRRTVLRRLRERGFGHLVGFVAGKDTPLRRESFAVAKLDHCLERLRGPEFSEHVWTDRRTVAQVADRIAASAGLELAPDTDSALRGRLRRTWTSVKHIRFG